MKKLLALLLLISAAVPISSYTYGSHGEYPGTVYICTGPQSEKYHKTPKCKGLNKCSTEVQAVSKSEAQARGYKPCKICYR